MWMVCTGLHSHVKDKIMGDLFLCSELACSYYIAFKINLNFQKKKKCKLTGGGSICMGRDY